MEEETCGVRDEGADETTWESEGPGIRKIQNATKSPTEQQILLKPILRFNISLTADSINLPSLPPSHFLYLDVLVKSLWNDGFVKSSRCKARKN
jgi:hypothetical protein